ncbi:MAG: hypothetical protein GX940_09715 [Clostridiaceae bacterium]|jgi:hypothetical protein|nr:hypothetical protein [Clostridiaceae bacterium]
MVNLRAALIWRILGRHLYGESGELHSCGGSREQCTYGGSREQYTYGGSREQYTYGGSENGTHTAKAATLMRPGHFLR